MMLSSAPGLWFLRCLQSASWSGLRRNREELVHRQIPGVTPKSYWMQWVSGYVSNKFTDGADVSGPWSSGVKLGAGNFVCKIPQVTPTGPRAGGSWDTEPLPTLWFREQGKVGAEARSALLPA